MFRRLPEGRLRWFAVSCLLRSLGRRSRVKGICVWTAPADVTFRRRAPGGRKPVRSVKDPVHDRWDTGGESATDPVHVREWQRCTGERGGEGAGRGGGER